MGGSTNKASAAALKNPAAVKDDIEWAESVCAAHEVAKLTQESFSAAELHSAYLISPRGNIILSAGDPTSIVDDFPPTIEADVIFDFFQSTTAAKGIKFVASSMRRQTEWRHLFTLYSEADA